CAEEILSREKDFLAQQSMLCEEIEKNGHLILFLPKLHCELNWIKYYWGEAK
ncbi:hypothetical protein L873DRAFT_1689734, partial [Choiromyces venosus 120613-1]